MGWWTEKKICGSNCLLLPLQCDLSTHLLCVELVFLFIKKRVEYCLPYPIVYQRDR